MTVLKLRYQYKDILMFLYAVCGFGWSFYNNHCYLYNETMKSWMDAEVHVFRNIYVNMHCEVLMRITHINENRNVQNY